MVRIVQIGKKEKNAPKMSFLIFRFFRKGEKYRTIRQR